MRIFFSLVLFFIAASTSLNAQAQKSNEQAGVEQAVTKFFDGLADQDAKILMQYSTKDFLLLEDGALWNMDTLLNYLNSLKAVSFNRINHLNFIKTDVKGNTAWVAYNNTADLNINGQKMNIQWLESAVLVKDGNQWKVQMLHSTSLKTKAN